MFLLSVALVGDNPTVSILEYNKNYELQNSHLREIKGKNNTISSLFLVIEDILQGLSLSYFDLNECISFSGPGSFTNIRIGISAIRGIALSAKIKAYCFNNMEIMAFRVQNDIPINRKMISLSKAFSDSFYCQCFTGNFLNSSSDTMFLEIDDLCEFIDCDEEQIIVVDSDFLQGKYNNMYTLTQNTAEDLGKGFLFAKQNNKLYNREPIPLYIRSAEIAIKPSIIN